MSPKRTKNKPVVLCAHGDYKANFEANFHGLRMLEKQFLTVLLKKQQKALRNGVVLRQPISGLAVIDN